MEQSIRGLKLGVFLPSFGYNQDAIQIVTRVNTLVSECKDIYPALFFKRSEPFRVRPKTIVTTFDKLYQYDGHLITSNLDTTYIALQCSRLKSINFYISELEWTKGIGTYLHNIQIYQNKLVNLICPSREYADAVENYCGVKSPDIITGFDIYEIATRIRTRNT